MIMTPTILDRLLAISSLFQADMKRAFAGTTLTETRVHALWALRHIGPSTQQSLAGVLGTTARSVSALVDGLSDAGYVKRIPHPDDRRAVLVTLTPQADEMMTRMQQDHEELSRQIIESVDVQDRPAFERGIDAVFWRVNELVRGDPVRYIDLEDTDFDDDGSGDA